MRPKVTHWGSPCHPYSPGSCSPGTLDLPIRVTKLPGLRPVGAFEALQAIKDAPSSATEMVSDTKREADVVKRGAAMSAAREFQSHPKDSSRRNHASNLGHWLRILSSPISTASSGP